MARAAISLSSLFVGFSGASQPLFAPFFPCGEGKCWCSPRCLPPCAECQACRRASRWLPSSLSVPGSWENQALVSNPPTHTHTVLCPVVSSGKSSQVPAGATKQPPRVGGSQGWGSAAEGGLGTQGALRRGWTWCRATAGCWETPVVAWLCRSIWFHYPRQTTCSRKGSVPRSSSLLLPACSPGTAEL